MAFTMNTNMTNMSSNTPEPPKIFGSTPTIRDIVLAIVIAIDILAFCANLAVIVVILSAASLRKTISSIFVLNLCTLDLLASLLVMPFTISVIVNGRWIWSEHTCSVNGFINATFVFESILTICAIHIEKYYCIKYPLHHHGTVNSRTVVTTLLVMWAGAFSLAALPLICWNGYAFQETFMHCTFWWTRSDAQEYFAVFVGLLFFMIPLCGMVYISCGIYKIAKRAMLQVTPIQVTVAHFNTARPSIVVVGTDGESYSHFSSFGETDFTTQACTSTSEQTTPIEDSDSGFAQSDRFDKACSLSAAHLHSVAIRRSMSRISHVLTDNDAPTPNRPSVANYKALRSLVCPFLHFLLVWGPFFLINMYWTFSDGLPHDTSLMIVCLLLVYMSYAMNAVMYGLLSRSFREEAMEALRSYCCWSAAADGPTGNSPRAEPTENITQFLHRGSYSVEGVRCY